MKLMRLEYKFLVPNDRIDELRSSISPFVLLDEYAAREVNNEYTVHSIYYDTMKLDDYHDKLAGIKIRKKLRIRGYNLQDVNSLAFLEIKRKYENHISKNRAPLLYSNLAEILKTSDYEKYLMSLL
jgi:SPX domain protein involved in polyphosphate accumulation